MVEMLWKWGQCGRKNRECARERDRNREWDDERLKVTDVSCLAISDMINSLAVSQMHGP